MTSIWNCPTPDPNYEANQHARVMVFTKIAPEAPKSWKEPIDCWINEADLADCKQACVYFTGSKLHVVGRARSRGQVKVKAAGYYATIGA